MLLFSMTVLFEIRTVVFAVRVPTKSFIQRKSMILEMDWLNRNIDPSLRWHQSIRIVTLFI